MEPVSFYFIIRVSLLAIAGFTTFLSVFLLLSGDNFRLLPNRLLALWLCGMATADSMLFLIDTQLITTVPWLFRLPSPLYYAMFPASWLYLRMILDDDYHFKRWDWLHFVPCMVHFIELTPYYLTHLSYKEQNIYHALKDPLGAFRHTEGWMPAYYHNFIRAGQGVIYGLVMAWKLMATRKENMNDRFHATRQWLWVDMFMLELFAGTIMIILLFPGIASISLRTNILSVVMSAAPIVTFIYMFYHPEILYGIPNLRRSSVRHQPQRTDPRPDVEKIMNPPNLAHSNSDNDEFKTTSSNNNNGEDEIIQNSALYNGYKKMVNDFMVQNQPFLKKGYRLSNLAADTGIPQHHLSFLLNNVYKQRFSDFINSRRIEYIRQNQSGDQNYQQFTLEALALQAGFSNRITFIRAVQRLTGENPSTYFKT